MRTLHLWACIALLGSTRGDGFDAYLQLQVNGSPVATDPVHSWVEVLGFAQGVENVVNIGSVTGGGGAGKVSARPVTLTIASDGSVATMLRGVAIGESFSLTLDFVRSSQQGDSVFVKLEFEDVLFSAVEASGGGGRDIVSFDVTFQYGKMIFTQSQFDQKGTRGGAIQASLDFVTNRTSGPFNTTPPRTGDYDGRTPPPNPNNQDNDGDGMPNDWETTFGLNKNSSLDAGLDTDGDGFTNLEEFIAGTHPGEATSFFSVRITRQPTNPGPPEVTLTWTGKTGRHYQILESTDPSASFQLLHETTATANGAMQFNPAPGAGPFFRISVSE